MNHCGHDLREGTHKVGLEYGSRRWHLSRDFTCIAGTVCRYHHGSLIYHKVAEERQCNYNQARGEGESQPEVSANYRRAIGFKRALPVAIPQVSLTVR